MATSIGANDQVADASLSTRDFLAKYAIVKKETKETIYWLTFIKDTDLVLYSVVDPYLEEGNEILRVVSKIIENTRHKK